MKNILRKIQYYLFFILFPLDFINIILFATIWVITFDRSIMYDSYGNIDFEKIKNDAFQYFFDKREVMKHLKIIYLLIILAIFCL